jgi:hypothetical protein
MDDFHQFEPYVQDDIKVNNRLTLNLGLRWFYIPHVYSDALSMFESTKYDPAQAPTVNPDGTLVPGTGNLLNGIVVANQNGTPRGLVPTHRDTFGPRIAFAWDPSGSGKMAIRGGYGVGYFRTSGNDVQRMAGNPPFSQVATFFDPPFNNPSEGVAPSVPRAIAGLDETYDVAKAQSWSLGVQRELRPNLGISVAYVGTQGNHIDEIIDINQPYPVSGYDFDPRIACTPTTPYPCVTRISEDYVRPYAGYDAITNTMPVGKSFYHSLQVSLQKKYSSGLQFGVAYTWSKVIGLGVGSDTDLGAGGQNYYDRATERGPGLYDRPQVLVVNYVYELPFFKGFSGVGGDALKGVLKGWEVTGLLTFESGTPVTAGLTSATQGLAQYPDVVSGVPLKGPKTAEQWFNTQAFTAPPFGYFGNAGVGIIRGPGYNNWDCGFFKNFRFKERGNVQVRAEMFNTWNHTSFNTIDATFGDPSFGQVLSAHTPRVVQIALRLSF